ncbi:MAG: Methyltransferase type 11 [Parcubacteria group bacterium Gr01-1014_13]|nr:MAG: Methyltransferase type 11 [Parcubacteria group bacterium Gr01-1014_13]
MTAHYDDPAFSYTQYWQGREYEYRSEVVALEKLLDGTRFGRAADIGGGFGRLTPLLVAHAKQTFLVEPSQKMRKMTRGKYKVMAGSAGRTRLPDDYLDCAMLIRVLHHLPNLEPVFAELARIVKPGGVVILEFANSLNVKSRIRSWVVGQPILPTSVDLRSQASIRKKYIHFVNHYPQTVLKGLAEKGFTVDRILSVSNFRMPMLKKVVPLNWLLFLEKMTQSWLGKLYFGPSLFVRARRFDKSTNP